MAAKNYKYFLYSKDQHNMRTEIEKKIGKSFIPGKVLTRGQWKIYTEISSNPNNNFADSKIIAEGYIEDMRYEQHKSIWGAR